MRKAFLGREDGQTAAEYTLILGGIAIVVAALVLGLGGNIRNLFQSTSDKLPAGPTMPADPPSVPYPTTYEQCDDPGWDTFPDMDNREECVAFVDTL